MLINNKNTLLAHPCTRRERHENKTTAYNKRLNGKIANPSKYHMIKALSILPKLRFVSFSASVQGLRHRLRPVSCRPFTVTAVNRPAGASALTATSFSLDVRCSTTPRTIKSIKALNQ